jgi:hypothetical protein
MIEIEYCIVVGERAMAARARYRKKADQSVIAVRLDLDTDGLVYRKWGAEQRAKRGDWLVDNAGEVYTVDAKVFARTYQPTGLGTFRKVAPVWAQVATHAGSIKTKEGESHYKKGDYLVFNNKNATDGYCMSPKKFHSMYEPDNAPKSVSRKAR